MAGPVYAGCYEPPEGIGLVELRDAIAAVVADAEATRSHRTLEQRRASQRLG